jgi:hypothetical protein
MSISKSNIITYRDCALAALVIQHKKHMRRTVLPALTSLVVTYFRRILVNGPIFGNKSLEHKTRVLHSL